MFEKLFNKEVVVPLALCFSLVGCGSAPLKPDPTGSHAGNVVKSVVNRSTLPVRREGYEDAKRATNLPPVDHNKPVLENIENIGTGVWNKIKNLGNQLTPQ